MFRSLIALVAAVLVAPGAFAQEADPGLATEFVSPEAAWDGVFHRSRTTSVIGTVAPLAAAGGAAVFFATRQGNCEFCVLVPLFYGGPVAALGPPLLAGGTMRQCKALKMVGAKQNCALSWTTWGLLAAGAVAIVPAPAVGVSALVGSYVVGLVAFADVETRHKRADLDLVTMDEPRVRFGLTPIADRRGMRGVALVGGF